MIISTEKVYSLALSMYLLFKFEIFNQFTSNIAGLLTVILLTIILFNKKYSIAEIFIFFLLLSIFILNGILSGDGNFIFILAFIFASKDYNLKKILLTFIKMYFFYFIYMIMRNVLGLESSSYSIKYVNGILTYVRNYGFGHPNQLSIKFSIFVIMILYYKKDKLNWVYYLSSLIGGLGIFELTSSKTGLVLLIIGLVSTAITKKVVMQRLLCVTLLPLSGLIIFFSLYLPLIYDESSVFMLKINNLFTGRIRLAHNFFERYPITFFGQSLDFSGYDNVLDSIYAFVLLKYGIVTFFVLMVLIVILLNKMVQNKLYFEAILFQFFLIIGISELTPINLSYNFTLVFFSLLLSNNIGKYQQKN